MSMRLEAKNPRNILQRHIRTLIDLFTFFFTILIDELSSRPIEKSMSLLPTVAVASIKTIFLYVINS